MGGSQKQGVMSDRKEGVEGDRKGGRSDKEEGVKETVNEGAWVKEKGWGRGKEQEASGMG